MGRVVPWFSNMPRGFFSRPSGCPPSGKIKHVQSLAVLDGHIHVHGSMWLATNRSLACLQLEHVIEHALDNSASQLRVRMISLPNYYYYYYNCFPSCFNFGHVHLNGRKQLSKFWSHCSSLSLSSHTLIISLVSISKAVHLVSLATINFAVNFESNILRTGLNGEEVDL